MSHSYIPKDALVYTKVEVENQVEHTLKWFIPKFLSIINCKYIKTYESKYVDNIQGEQFKILIKVCGANNDLYEIYYYYAKHVVLHRAIFTLLDVIKGNKFRDDEVITDKGIFTIAANKWHHLKNIR